jgi:hypothetical protein
MTRFYIAFRDINDTLDMDLWQPSLRRVHLATGVSEVMAGDPDYLPWGSANTNPIEGYFSIPSGMQLVSSDYAYYVTFCIPDGSLLDIRFYGARLLYTP